MLFDVTDTVAAGALPVAIAVALLAGLVSFASPCVLPLVPGFLGYVTGRRRARRAREEPDDPGALLFVAGFSAVFIATTAFLASIGAALVEHRTLLMRVGGVLVILMALVFLGAGSQREVKLRSSRPPAWPAIPCWELLGIGGPARPMGAVVLLATTTGDQQAVTRGIVLAAAYCLGLGLPFLLIAAGFERFGRVSAALRRHQRGIQLFGVRSCSLSVSCSSQVCGKTGPAPCRPSSSTAS